MNLCNYIAANMLLRSQTQEQLNCEVFLITTVCEDVCLRLKLEFILLFLNKFRINLRASQDSILLQEAHLLIHMFLCVKINKGPVTLGITMVPWALLFLQRQLPFNVNIRKCSGQHSPVCGFGFLSQLCLLSLQWSHIWFECNAKHLLISTYFGLLISFRPALKCHLKI